MEAHRHAGLEGHAESSAARTLLGLFEERVREAPDQVAVIADGRSLTYRELNTAANKLAWHLRGRYAIGREDLVGIIVDRSERILIGILATMKAGGGYVPIDPQYPANAIQFMLGDSGAKAFLVDSQHVDKVGKFFSTAFILDLELEQLETPTEDPSPEAGSANLAYAIYTSGSTGRRKGVVVEHDAIVRTIQWRLRFYEFDSRMVAVQIPSYALDSSIVDIFATLACGGTILMLSEETRTDVAHIGRLAALHGATHLLATPTFYRVLMPALSQAASLKCVTVAGEAISEDLVEEHYRRLPGVVLVNEYGPTENAVCSTATVLRPGATYVSIGVPIADTEVLLLDENFEPVADGEPGEVYLGGKRLARAYHRRPDLTAERFVPHPSPIASGDRLYRTGDAARRHSNGDLEFLGRLDHQVKIRGFRIELGEIECTLREHPKVEDAVVLCLGDEDAKYLAAYVVAHDPPSWNQLRRYVAGLLPEHMVPTMGTFIDRVPMTPNGKLDRDSLPSLAISRADMAAADGTPRSENEKRLLETWRDILNAPMISVHDNFFEIGGNSLRAAQLQTEIHARFGVEVALHRLFTDPTIAGLAEIIETHAAQAPRDTDV